MSVTDDSVPMESPTRPRSTRDRPSKAPLSEDAVVDAALEILKSDGLDAVTMRRVAAALDTGAASLYVYVSSRETLFQAMFDRVTAMIELEPPDPLRWRAQLHELLQRMRQVLAAHPGIAAMTLANPITTEAVLLLTDNLLGILAAGGIGPQDGAWACDMLILIVSGIANEDDVRRARGLCDGTEKQELVEGLYRTFASLPPERFPFLSAHAAEMVAGDVDHRFRFAIDVVLDGVLARAAREERATSAPGRANATPVSARPARRAR